MKSKCIWLCIIAMTSLAIGYHPHCSSCQNFLLVNLGNDKLANVVPSVFTKSNDFLALTSDTSILKAILDIFLALSLAFIADKYIEKDLQRTIKFALKFFVQS